MSSLAPLQHLENTSALFHISTFLDYTSQQLEYKCLEHASLQKLLTIRKKLLALGAVKTSLTPLLHLSYTSLTPLSHLISYTTSLVAVKTSLTPA
jgi:hypothetical protein